MRITPGDRLGFRGDLALTRADSRLLYLCAPVLVDEAYDLDTGSADDPSDGDGLGQIPSQWRVYGLRAHFRNVDTALMTYGHVPPGVELGDALVNFGPRDLATVQQTMANKDHYVLIDGQCFTIISLLPSGVGQIEEWSFDARAYTPAFRAKGY